METIMHCALYAQEAEGMLYHYDVVFTEVGPAIKNLIKEGFEHLSVGKLEIFDNGGIIYECTIK